MYADLLLSGEHSFVSLLELVFVGNICGFSSKFFADKAKICRHTFVWQEFLTQYATKFAEKSKIDAYEHELLKAHTLQRVSIKGNTAQRASGDFAQYCPK